MTPSASSASPDSLTIRPVGPADQAAWADLYRQYANFYQVPMTDEILARTWAWLLAPDHGEEGLVAARPDGTLVGFAHFRAFPKPLLGRDAGYLDDLFVDPTQRGGGVARRLVAAVADIGRERGWLLVRWITAPDNTPARGLYDQVAEATPWVTYDLKL